MWILFGGAAIIAMVMNIIWFGKKGSSKWFRFASLALTALTVCAFYSQAAAWVSKGDWAALMDVVPTVNIALWILVAVSIIINSISLFRDDK